MEENMSKKKSKSKKKSQTLEASPQLKKEKDVITEGAGKSKVGRQELLVYALSFLLPVFVMLWILRCEGFYPFGEKTLFIMDMKGQYLEFYASLRNMFSGDDSLFFSWSRSMGGNYLGLFAYYVASPLSFLTILFPIKNMPTAILLLTLLKIGLAGTAFAGFGVYLWKKWGSLEEKSESGNVLLVLPFAVSYALISYNMVYSMCLMWLDGVILLPVILLGVEKLLDGGKGLHYMLALAALFICNYYTGYMAGVFTGIYMVYRILCEVEKGKIRDCLLKTLRFTINTLLAFGLSAPLILPVVKDLMQGKLASASYMPDTRVNFQLGDLISKLKNGIYDSITNSGLPSIYCGYLILFLAVVFLVLPRISIREKAGAVLILALLVCSFYYTKLDIAWHGFQYPTWFPYRYAFVCSFFLLYLALRAGGVICNLAKKILQKKAVWISAVLLFSLFILVDLGQNGRAMFQGLGKEFGYGSREEYQAFLDKTQPLVEQIQGTDLEFYRMNQGYEYSKNDAMLLGYHGMTHYSSTFHAFVNQLTPKLGIAQAHIWNSGYGSNPMLDSLFAVKYILEDGPVPAEHALVANSEGGAALYWNQTALSAVYSAPVTNLEPNVDEADPFVNQNNFLNTIAGTDLSYFTEYSYTTEQPDASWSYTFTADSTNPVYLYMKADRISWADVYVNDAWVGNYFSTETSCSLYLGNFQPGQQVVVRVVPSSEIQIYYAMIAQLHMDSLTETMNRLQEKGMDISRHKGGKLSGKITVGEGETIMTSIPYDEGWNVKVDGKKTETTKFADTFLAIPAESGDHEITFSYVSPGFAGGMILFLIALVLSLGYHLPRKYFRFRRKEEA